MIFGLDFKILLPIICFLVGSSILILNKNEDLDDSESGSGEASNVGVGGFHLYESWLGFSSGYDDNNEVSESDDEESEDGFYSNTESHVLSSDSGGVVDSSLEENGETFNSNPNDLELSSSGSGEDFYSIFDDDDRESLGFSSGANGGDDENYDAVIESRGEGFSAGKDDTGSPVDSVKRKVTGDSIPRGQWTLRFS